ncbi:esterase [Mycobacterium tuberculosis RGTB327]|nr:esterase [Mycobacterium tuberculosis RGTB327]
MRAADGAGRVVLYLHGGAFVMCGPNSHSRIVNALSGFAESPVLIVDYRLIPKHSLGMALDDCHDAYQWLRARGYRPEQIVLAGDSAGGYLALALAQRLQCDDEKPAAIVAISPFAAAGQGAQAGPSQHRDRRDVSGAGIRCLGGMGQGGRCQEHGRRQARRPL